MVLMDNTGLFALFKERNLNAIARNSGFRFSNTFFIYTSGKIGNYYVNSESVMKNGEDYAYAAESLSVMISKILGKEYDVISGGERRDFIFSNPVAVSIEKPHLSLYRDGRFIGADVNGKRIVHVSDLNNEGSSPRNLWIPMIRNLGGNVENIFFYVDRMEGGVNVMRDLGLERHAVVSLDNEAWNYLLKANVVSEDVYREIRDRMEDRDEWARRMLKTDRGFEQFVEYLKNTDMKECARKVMEVGYPDIKNELLERLKEGHRDVLNSLYC